MIAVTGATGTVGREVVTEVRATGASVRAITRDPRAARLPDGVDVVGADLSEALTLEPALEDVDAVFLVWPFTTPEGAPAILDAIARHARRIVYLPSAGGQRPEPEGMFHAECSIPRTVIRRRSALPKPGPSSASGPPVLAAQRRWRAGSARHRADVPVLAGGRPPTPRPNHVT